MKKLILVALSFLTPFLHGVEAIKTEPSQIIEVSAIVERKMVIQDGKRNKNLEVMIWSSGDFKSEEKKGLIVISHGLKGKPEQLNWLISSLVKAGYVVAGTTHEDLLSGQPHMNHWNRPLDISAMITGILESPMGQFIDTNKIGTAGFSLGGSTTLWLAGGVSNKLDPIYPGGEYASEKEFANISEIAKGMDREMMVKDYRDSRIKAAFMMAPAWGWVYDQKSLEKISIPVYIVAGDKDELLNTDNNAGYIAKYIPNAKYQKIEGAGHSAFVESKQDQLSNEAFLAKTAEEAVQFFESSLK